MVRNTILRLICLLAMALPPLCQGQGPFGRLDRQKEIELGREAYDWYLQNHRLSSNEAYIHRVQRVFDALLLAMGYKDYPYQVILLSGETINAWCLPGGYIAVYEGLVTRMPDDDVLAFVLAHEIGHAAHRHWAHQMRKSQGDILTGILIGGLLGPNAGSQYIGLRRIANTRQDEHDADMFGVSLYLKAGYDPADASGAMRYLAQYEDKKGIHVPDYLSDHPGSRSRVRDIDAEVAKLHGVVAPVAPPLIGDDVEATLYGNLPEATIGDNPYRPCSVGMTWQYAVGQNSSYTVKCVSVGITAKGPVARLETRIASTVVTSQVFATATESWVRNNISSGDSNWTQEFVFAESADQDRTVNDKTFRFLGYEDVKVPAGNYNGALKLQVVTGDRKLTLWFAKGVGLVRRLNESTGTDERLTSFTKGAN